MSRLTHPAPRHPLGPKAICGRWVSLRVLSALALPAALSIAAITPRPSAADPLSLQDCIGLALSQNLQHLSNVQSLERRRADLQQARAPFELNADANVTAPSYNERRDTFTSEALLARFREENTTFQYGGNLTLSQRVPHVGRFSMSATGLRDDFSSNRRQDFLDFSGDIRFSYTQDILSTPSEELGLRQAELGLSMGRYSLRRQQLQLESRATNAFYDLVQSIRQLAIQKQRLEQSEAALDLAQRKYEIGLIAEVQAIRLQLEKLRAEASYAQAETTIEGRRDALRELLGVELTDSLEVMTEVAYEKVPIDEDLAVEQGLRHRTDMQEAEILTAVRRLSLEETKQRVGPTAQLNTSVRLGGNGPEAGDVSSSFERKLVTARIDVQFPVLDGGWRRGQVRQAEIALEQSRLSRDMQRRAVILDIRDAVRNVREAERQIELRQAALQFAERTYEVEQSRFELGLADSQELLDAQTDLTSAQTDALAAVISYQRALKSLHLATMTDLSELVAAPTDG